MRLPFLLPSPFTATSPWLLRLRRPLLLALPGLLLCHAASAQSSAQPKVEVTMSRAKGYPSFDVSTAMTVDADVARSWAVLTDYNRLAEFVPNLSASHVVSQSGNERVVAQNGYARFLFLRQPVNLTLRVNEQPMEAIDIGLVSGNMRDYQARWELRSIDAGHTHVAYAGVIAPDFYVPSLFGAALMKSDLRAMLNAVKAEIERR